jgi:hypothetical protein
MAQVNVIVLYCSERELIWDLNGNPDGIVFNSVPNKLRVGTTEIWNFVNLCERDLAANFRQIANPHDIYLYKPNNQSRLEDDILLRAILDRRVVTGGVKIQTLSYMFRTPY